MSAQTLVSTARGELGVGCPGACNKYGSFYGMNCQAWCAMFVWWCAVQSGNSGVIPKAAYTPTFAAWYKARGQWGNGITGIKPGDIVFFNFGLGRISHVGIVESVGSGGVYTIEGNTSSSSQANGGCVQRKWRTVKGGIVGYSRPAYGTASVTKNWLEKGDSGAAVVELQSFLAAAGFDLGPYGIDGEFGDATRAALIAYQTSRGLEPDGYAGPLTMSALRSGKPPVARNADGSLTIAEDGIRGPATISRWQEVMATPIDGTISKPKSTLIVADQRYLNSVVDAVHIRNLTGKDRLDEDGSEGPKTVKVRQFLLYNGHAVSLLGRNPKAADFDGVPGSETTRLHQRALNLAPARSGRY